MSTQPQTTTEPTINQLANELETLRNRVDDLEETVEEKEERIADLEAENSRLEAMADAAVKKAGANFDRVAELQARELEKGAHLVEENVDHIEVNVAEGRLEKIQKEDGNSYFRLPESDDPLNRGGSTTLSHGDLLPIQQLAQMDDDMLHSSTSDLPSRLAAKVWKARVDETVGDDPWQRGCGEVREYLKASDMKHWIRRQEDGVSEEYAKKLVSRTISRLLDFSNNKLGVRKKNERKNGLQYTERRVILSSKAEIPGETSSKNDAPETPGVHR